MKTGAARATDGARPRVHRAGPAGAGDAPIRVLHVLATLLPGGSEISVLRLISVLDPGRYQVRVAWLRGEPVLENEFRAAGADVVPMGMRAKLDPACFLRLVRYVARERIDIVHTHMDVADFYGALAADFDPLARPPVAHREIGQLGGVTRSWSSSAWPTRWRTR